MGPLVQNDVPLRLDARPVPNVPEPRPVPAQAENASTATAERMHPFTLRFVGALEREFADEYFDQTLGPVRLAAALGFVLYTGLGALDPYVAAAHFQKLWLIRFVIVGPVILACFALTYAPSFRRVHEWVLSATILLAALGLIAMIVIIEEPGNFLYYAGLLLTMMFITLTRLSVPVTLAVTLAIVAVYAAAALFLTQLELRFVVNNLSFLASTMIVSLLANYGIERYARLHFFQRRLARRRTLELEQKNEELTAKNRMLAESRAATLRSEQRSELLFAALADALPGTVLDDKYRVGEKIGSGSFGTVYRGEHILLHHAVAIKVFRPAIGTSAREGLDRFRREGISACRINHPNAVTVFDFDVSAGSIAYLVMELLDGRSLAEELTHAGKLLSRRCIEIAVCVCDVLAEAHAAGIVHRDIKPSNIFLHRAKSAAGEEQVKVIDFGIAKLTDETIDGNVRSTMTGTLVGSPAYMAPERLLSDAYDGRVDVYGVGVVMYESLTGQLPYRTMPGGYVAFAAMRAQPPTAPATLEPGISPRLNDVIMRAIAREPSMRPTAAQLGKELRELLG